MDLQALLGGLSLAQFVGDYYQRLPYSSEGAKEFANWANWATLTALLGEQSVDVFVCRQNERLAGEPPRDAAAARRLLEQGYTLLVRHAERHHAELGRLAAAFERDFASSVNIHVYCTPPGQFGFGWHYDAEEVFIVQTVGSKEYALRKNTVNPWPLEETLPRDMQFEREIMPLWQCELSAGSWLYIPSGYWHKAQARELAISLAIGVQPQAAIDILDALRRELLQSLLWRQRLPVLGAASPLGRSDLRAQYAQIFGELGRDLGQRLAEPRAVERYLASRVPAGG
jgi:ribosomal protein L16 Arg81 hydroxylase